MRLNPSKVEFDKESYRELQEDIERLERELKIAERARENLSTIHNRFIAKLSEVADISGLDISQTDYDLFLSSSFPADNVKIVSRIKG